MKQLSLNELDRHIKTKRKLEMNARMIMLEQPNKQKWLKIMKREQHVLDMFVCERDLRMETLPIAFLLQNVPVDDVWCCRVLLALSKSAPLTTKQLMIRHKVLTEALVFDLWPANKKARMQNVLDEIEWLLEPQKRFAFAMGTSPRSQSSPVYALDKNVVTYILKLSIQYNRKPFRYNADIY